MDDKNVETVRRNDRCIRNKVHYTDLPLPMVQQSLVGYGLLFTEVPRSHSDTPHSVRLPWTSDQPDAETYT